MDPRVDAGSLGGARPVSALTPVGSPGLLLDRPEAGAVQPLYHL